MGGARPARQSLQIMRGGGAEEMMAAEEEMGSQVEAEGEEEEEEGSQVRVEGEEEEDGSQVKAPLHFHGDVLEAVLSRVPTIDLVSASRVSRDWRRAVRASLNRCPRLPTPYLIIHLQSRRNPSLVTTHAYDPLSRSWLALPRVPFVPPLRLGCSSSGPSVLYALSLSGFAYSTDACGSTWREAAAPAACRRDPVVALVGSRLVLAGGAAEFEDEEGAVEVLSASTSVWAACERMPEVFSGSSSATWLSAAASERKLYVMERSSGWASAFDPDSGTWGPTSMLRPDPAVFASAIGRAGGRLILAGALGDAARGSVTGVGLWEVEPETLAVVGEMGRMPAELVERMMGEEASSWCMGLASAGDAAYLYNTSHPTEAETVAVLCDLSRGCRWEIVPFPAGLESYSPAHRALLTCSPSSSSSSSSYFPPHHHPKLKTMPNC